MNSLFHVCCDGMNAQCQRLLQIKLSLVLFASFLWPRKQGVSRRIFNQSLKLILLF
jgi:hypothetical protein